MKHILLFTFFILLFQNSFSQLFNNDTTIVVFGNIHSEKNEVLPFVHVLIKGSAKGTISDINGYFSINIEKEDTLLFSSLGFKKQELFINDTLNRKKIFVNIQLDTETYQLAVVSIYGLTKDEQLKYEFINMELVDDEYEVALNNFPAQFNRTPAGKVTNTQLSMTIGGPISALYNQFSKEGKSLRKLKKLRDEDTIDAKVIKLYSKQIVSNFTGLEGDALIKFMEFLNLSDELVLSLDEYDLYKLISDKYKEFLKQDQTG